MKSRMSEILLKNAKCYLPTGLEQVDLRIKDGLIAEIGKNLDGDQFEDLNGLTILPGVIDSQVHFRDPGLTHKEDLESGSLAAAHGGITAFFEMPNTAPPTTTIPSLQEKLDLAATKSYVDYAFFIGADGENFEEIAKAYQHPGCCGIKIFLGSSTGPLLFNDEEKILLDFCEERRDEVFI